MLNRTSRVKFPLGLNVGLMRQLWCRKTTNGDALTKRGYAGRPARPISILGNAKEAAAAVLSWFTLVLRVPGSRNIAKIGNPVVVAIPVDVVNYAKREFSVDVEPCKPMSHESLVVNVHIDASIIADIPGNCPGWIHAPTDKPSEYSGFWVVVEKFAQACCGKIGLSHAVVPYKQWCGEKPRCVTSTSGLRYFKGLHYCKQALVSGVSI